MRIVDILGDRSRKKLRAGSVGAGKNGSRRGGRILVVSGAAALTAAIAWGVFGGGGPTPDGDSIRIHREDLVLTVEIEGELAAVRATEIGAPPVRDLWDYKISFLVPESTVVKKGQPVLGFDAQPLQKSLEEKNAEFAEASKKIERREIELAMQLRDQELALAEAEAKLGKARLKAEIPDDLKGGIEGIQARLDLADLEKEVQNLSARLEATRRAGEADVRALRSRRDRARARTEELTAAIEGMMVRAPQDGVVIYKSGWRDEKKKVGDSTWVGEKVLELPDLSSMRANAQVDEADAGQVAEGQKATVRLEARPDVDFTGRVRRIGQTVQRKSWRVPAKVYRIEIALDRTDPAVMRPAMRFRGEIETLRVSAVLVAPRSAVFLRPRGPVVWVLRARRWTEVAVRLGRSSRQGIEVLDGLEEGDEISPVDLRRPDTDRRHAPLSAGL